MAYLVQGFFFQNHLQVGIGIDPKQGPRAMVSKAEVQHMFAAAIWEGGEGELVGKMRDDFGPSDLSDISISKDEIEFVKKYEHRETLIHYVFRVKDGNSWVGRYEGTRSGEGVCRCVLTEVPEDFFFSEPILEILASKVP